MSRVVWTSGAAEDLLKRIAFLEEIDADAAIKAADAIIKGAGILRRFPNAGRPAEDLEPEQKELIVPFGSAGYVLLYEIEGQEVNILALRHQKEAGY